MLSRASHGNVSLVKSMIQVRVKSRLFLVGARLARFAISVSKKSHGGGGGGGGGGLSFRNFAATTLFFLHLSDAGEPADKSAATSGSRSPRLTDVPTLAGYTSPEFWIRARVDSYFQGLMSKQLELCSLSFSFLLDVVVLEFANCFKSEEVHRCFSFFLFVCVFHPLQFLVNRVTHCCIFLSIFND